MTSSIIYRRTDPNFTRGKINTFKVGENVIRVKKDRGPGYYYHRGNGYFSKYSESRDAKIKAKGHNVHPIGAPKHNRVRHSGDGFIKRR
jgi:hypothetical protein